MSKKQMHSNGNHNLNFIGLIMMDIKMQLLELQTQPSGILMSIWEMALV
jgi:hypothetical protein